MVREAAPSPPELGAVLETIRQVGRGLAEVEKKLSALAGHPIPNLPSGSVDVLEVAKRLYAERRMRNRFLPEALFAEPAWDLLLDLYVAQHERRLISTSSACIAALVPATTALRWLGRLEKEGLVARRPDSRDERLHVVELTPGAFAAMTDLFIRMGLELQTYESSQRD